jgi:hypothetical protein
MLSFNQSFSHHTIRYVKGFRKKTRVTRIVTNVLTNVTTFTNNVIHHYPSEFLYFYNKSSLDNNWVLWYHKYGYALVGKPLLACQDAVKRFSSLLFWEIGAFTPNAGGT